MKLRFMVMLGFALAIGAAASARPDDSSEGNSDEACPCATKLTFLKTRPTDSGAGGTGRSITTTAMTWTGSDTWKGGSQHRGKVGGGLGGKDILSFSTSYERTITEENGSSKVNEKAQAVVEYSDFTTNQLPGACYSYVEEEKCSDETYAQCIFDIDFKITFHNGPANQDYVDIGTAITSAKTNRGPPPSPPDMRLDTPGQVVPVHKEAHLDCGSWSQFYMTSYEPVRYKTPTLSFVVRYDFGYKSACGECPEKPGDV